MKISFGQHLQQKQTQTLAPRMIQSMEILQMAQAELQEKIEQELVENPVLERGESDVTEAEPVETSDEIDVEEKELVIGEDGKNDADDFERLLNLDREVPDHFDERPRPSANRIQQSSDLQHDLMANVENRVGTLQDYLIEQLANYDLDEKPYKMCLRIISSLNADDGGYLKTTLQDLLAADAEPDDLEIAEEALATIQLLDPAGIAARDLRECLQLQLAKKEIPHLSRVRRLINDHLEDLQFNSSAANSKSNRLYD